MRKCKALPGARTELLSDLLIPKQDGQLCERTLCPHRTLLAEKWDPRCLGPGLCSAHSRHKQDSNLPLFSVPQMSSSSSGSPFSPLARPCPVSSFWFSDPGLGDLGFVPQLRERPRCREFNPGGGTGGPSPALPWVGALMVSRGVGWE